jgi:hypothetical protein
MTRSKRAAKGRSPKVVISETISRRRASQRKRGDPSLLRPGQVSVHPGSSSSMMVVVPSTKRSVRRAPQSSRRSVMDPKSQYLESLLNPFDHSPPKVMAGTLFPLARKRAFLRTIIPVANTATSTVYTFIHVPLLNAVNTGGYGGVALYTSTSLTAVPTYVSNTTYANAALIAGEADTGRVITGGISVQVKEGFNTVPASIYVGATYSSEAALGALTTTALNNLSGATLVRTDNNCLGGYSEYRPNDLTAYELVQGVINGSPNTGFWPMSWVTIVVPALTAFTFEINAILHLETNAGNDPDNGDDMDQDAAGTLSGTVEELGRSAINTETPPGGSISEILFTAVDAAMASHAMRERGRSLRSEGGLVGRAIASGLIPAHLSVDTNRMPSSSCLPPDPYIDVRPSSTPVLRRF